MKPMPWPTAVSSTLSLALLASCGGGGGSPPATTQAGFQVRGVVAGLAASGLTLQLNGGSPMAIAASGDFAFSDHLRTGDSYLVAVGAQAAPSAQGCVVVNGTGQVGNAEVRDVSVLCGPSPFKLLSSFAAGLGADLARCPETPTEVVP